MTRPPHWSIYFMNRNVASTLANFVYYLPCFRPCLTHFIKATAASTLAHLLYKKTSPRHRLTFFIICHVSDLARPTLFMQLRPLHWPIYFINKSRARHSLAFFWLFCASCDKLGFSSVRCDFMGSHLHHRQVLICLMVIIFWFVVFSFDLVSSTLYFPDSNNSTSTSHVRHGLTPLEGGTLIRRANGPRAC